MTKQTCSTVNDPLAAVVAGGSLFESPQQSLGGFGELDRLELGFTHSTISNTVDRVIDNLQQYGNEAIAFVSIPFNESASVLSLVPSEVVAASGPFEPAAPANDPPTSFSISPSRAPKKWCDAVHEAVERINRGELDKVVLARQIDVEADRDFDIAAVLANLRHDYSSSYRFAIDGLVGASPELLVERRGLKIRSQPLAGTRAHSGDETSDANAREDLMSSVKDQDEHRYVPLEIRRVLTPLCSSLHIDAHTEVKTVRNVQHLSTNVEGYLKSDATTAMHVAAALNPTPAVGGYPTSKAIELITELEDMDRGRYAGAVGWVNAQGDGCFAVAIRCAQITGTSARLYAGVGVVAQSNPTDELSETQWKLQAMLNALVRP